MEEQKEAGRLTLEEEFGRLDKTALRVFHSFEEAEEADRVYWHSCSPDKRLRYIEYLRRMNYGDKATARIQNVIEFSSRP